MAAEAVPRLQLTNSLRWVAVGGPGLLVMLSDTDVGNVVTAAQAGTQWGYRLLPLLVLLIPMLYMVQELTVRLGIHTKRGYGELIRKRFGAGWAWMATTALAVAVIGSLVTQFTGVAGIGELYGVPRGVSLSLSVVALLAIVATGSYRRVERMLIFIGGFELAFFVVAWASHPNITTIAKDLADMPIGNSEYMFLVAAIIGAVFSPWMIFYQQSAVAEKQLSLCDLKACRWDTAIGAVLTQCLTGAIVIVGAAALARSGSTSLHSVGEISSALSPLLGETVGRLVFSAGVLGASIMAAVVCSLALTWGVSEASGLRRSMEIQPFRMKWFYGIYMACVAGSATLVWLVPNLVQLNIATQTLNVFLLPLVVGLLLALAVKVLPEALRPRRTYCWVLAGISVIVLGVGMFGAVSGSFQRLFKIARPVILSRHRATPAGGQDSGARVQTGEIKIRTAFPN